MPERVSWGNAVPCSRGYLLLHSKDEHRLGTFRNEWTEWGGDGPTVVAQSSNCDRNWRLLRQRPLAYGYRVRLFRYGWIRYSE